MGREGAEARRSGHIYLAVVQSVIMYGSETWGMTPHIDRMLDGFHRLAYRLPEKQPWQGRDGVWKYPPLEDAMAEAGLQEVENDVSCLKNTVEQFIATRTIMNLCLAVERRPGPQVSRR